MRRRGLTIDLSTGDLEMLAGNLASIGVGGIVTCVSSYFVRGSCALSRQRLDNVLWKWPEDFNFEITRVINAPHTASDPPSPKEPADFDDKKDTASADAHSVLYDERIEKDELDPAKLHKAFKFAAWSSVILVR